MTTALVSGFIYRRVRATDVKNIWWLALIISVPATIVSTIITVILFHGITSSGSSLLVQILYGLGFNQALSVFIIQVGTDFLDRLIGVYVVAAVYKTITHYIK